MNRKNLTAAVLAGLAGVAGLAGNLQAEAHLPGPAVNLNPDGLGEVLLYPYYTTNDHNVTLMTVVNTTAEAKAVKVRFLEGFNSREVLDFNLYLSAEDVWVAAIADDAGTPTLLVPDTSCTVPYLYGDFDGKQEFLDYAFTGDFEDGGPTDISRAAEGYIEIIEMGEMTGADGRGTFYDDDYIDDDDPGRMDSAMAATHTIKEDEDGHEYVEPYDCDLLVDNWTEYLGNVQKPDPWSGWWLQDALKGCDASTVEGIKFGDIDYPISDCGLANGDNVNGADESSLTYNSGGLFGGAAIINVPAGTMVSYDARAVQGYDVSHDGLHFFPGTIHPSLNDGNVTDAIVFLGAGQTARLGYADGVDAISAVFMHDEIANTYVIEESTAAATEWVVTHPTKSWYVDPLLLGTDDPYYEPDPEDAGCNGWNSPEPFPMRTGTGYTTQEFYSEACEDNAPGVNGCSEDYDPDWEQCTYLKLVDQVAEQAPFTDQFDGEACEEAWLATWDREESPTIQGGSIRPPIVSPAPPGTAPEGEAPFELCFEVNVLRFGERSVFGGALVDDGGLTYSVGETAEHGWARITLAGSDGEDHCVSCDDDDNEQHVDQVGMRGLPVTGFSAETYTNGNVADGVLANYGGLFNHKGSVRCDVVDGEDDCVSNAQF